MGEEFVSCSKKCRKVTKFAYMLRQKNEQEILRAFESMLRKKVKKQLQAGCSQNYLKNDFGSAVSGNRTSMDHTGQLYSQHHEKRGGFTMIEQGKTYKSQRVNQFLSGAADEDEELKQLDKQ